MKKLIKQKKESKKENSASNRSAPTINSLKQFRGL